MEATSQLSELGLQGPTRAVRVFASTIVSLGDTGILVKTAANRLFAKPDADQISILTDLLSSCARRAINLLTHDQLFSAKSAPRVLTTGSSPSAAIVAAPTCATADIVQARRAKEATIDAERIISDRQRELEETKAGNASLIAQAEAKSQEARGVQRVADSMRRRSRGRAPTARG